MKIYNGTAHDVIIYDRFCGVVFDPVTRKHYLTGTGRVVKSFPKGEKMLSVRFSVDRESIDGVEVHARRVVEIDPLPEGYDYYIVSAQYAIFAPVKEQLLVVGDPLYEPVSKDTEQPRPIGCLCLVHAEVK